MKCVPATVITDPPAGWLKDGFTPATVGWCNTSNRDTKVLCVASKQVADVLSISLSVPGSERGGMTHDRIVEVKNVDREAGAAVSVQQNTSEDASKPFPKIDTSDELITYPELGTMLSYTAPLATKKATAPVDGNTKSSPFKLIDTVTLPDSCSAYCTTHSTTLGDISRPGTTS